MNKKLLLFACLLAGCKGKVAHQSDLQADSAVYYPYEAIYTEGFDKGRPDYSQKVLAYWKELENGQVKNRRADFTDSLRIIFPDRILSGKKDTVLQEVQKRRDSYSDVQFYLDAWLPVKATDPGEELVMVWGRQDCKSKKGNRDYLVLHEIWHFDRKGKIRQMEQYITHPF